MKKLLLMLLILSTGLIVGCDQQEQKAAEETVKKVKWKMASAFPGSLVQIGTLGVRLQNEISKISGGNITIKFFEPSALVPALEIFDAVSTGGVDAGWGTPGYWAGKVPALQLFSSVPFGPPANEYMSWVYFGGGKEFYEELYARHNIKGMLCGIIPPEASGWFRKEIKGPEDLKGLKMRFFGLGAKVMEKVGVSTQLLAGGDIYPALELGTIDSAEFSMPAIDLELGFYQIAKHYYFPGWHQQSTFMELMINLEKWNALSVTQQAQIEATCGDNFRHAIAEGEGIQGPALKTLQEKGVELHTWSPEMLAIFENGWNEVVAELVESDEDFSKIWASLTDFRKNYKVWKELGYLK
jgi:TRAP-type mannitol/chloroaromatic compound transport system substrate-binding protein